MKKIDIAKLPELPTAVGIHGSSRKSDVAGPLCAAVVVGAALFALGQFQQRNGG